MKKTSILRITGTPKLVKKYKERFEEEIKEIKGISAEIICYKELYYDGNFRNIFTGKILKTYDKYIIGGVSSLLMKEGLIYYYGTLLKKNFLDKLFYNNITNNKFIQLLFANHYKIKTPYSLFFIIHNTQFNEAKKIIENKLEYPFIGKDVTKDRGEGVFLIKNKEELKNIFDKNKNNGFIFQEFIKNDGDIRIITIGNKYIGAIKRFNENNVLNNISKGGSSIEFNPNKKTIKLARKISKKYGLGLSGIDFFIKNDEPILIEINDLPQYEGFENTTKINLIKKLLIHLKKK